MSNSSENRNEANVLNHQTDPSWKRLTDKKSFSRILYTNPVCFLSAVSNDVWAATPTSQKGQSSATSVTMKKNVMVLSWITATNNFGRFVFSINRRRFTSKAITSKPSNFEFVLSVPIQGMEDLVLDVGRRSTKWGSKFSEYHEALATPATEANFKRNVNLPCPESLVNHAKKKRVKNNYRFSPSIPNLKAVPLGNEGQNTKECLFAIDGTIACMKCRTICVLEESDSNVVDDEHFLVAAEIFDAYINPNYWDDKMNQFRPLAKDIPPYLTFFGSQTFGYVHNE